MLDRGLRRELAKAVRSARKTAEAGARNALTALMVADAEPDPSFSREERALRHRLRAHGRQLGDEPTGARQVTGRLAHEIAYEHWHRMLFARFLAENRLLVEPKSGVSVSLNECQELARESGQDPWALAGECAAAMLPRMFRPDDPSLAVRLPLETQRSLEKTLNELPVAVFKADDALGWTYQFWQADRKNEVGRAVKSGAKVGSEELPAVTQLFTEPYMVRFLFHNTVGAWRAERILEKRPDLAESAESEEDLRRAVRLEAAGGYDFDYLRFVRESSDQGAGTGRWRPAPGSFDKWPRHASDLRILDPCCGSGHFLIEGLHILVRMRMEEEDLAIEEAIQRVLGQNLHGLEIDPRCTQIAAFSMAFTAWKLAGRVIDLPRLQIACSGLAPNSDRGEWVALAERMADIAGAAPQKDLFRTQDTLTSGALRHTFETLYDLFDQAPTLGSLLDPHQTDRRLFTAAFDAVQPLLDEVLRRDVDAERREQTLVAAGIADGARFLTQHYSLVVTNVPFLGINDHDLILRNFAARHHARSKHDLATMFLERSMRWLSLGGTTAIVSPDSWLFLPRYRGLREDLLSRRRWRFVTRLGPRAFESISGHVVNATLVVIGADKPDDGWRMTGLDVSVSRDEHPTTASQKDFLLRGSSRADTEDADGTPVVIRQSDQRTTPDSRVLLQPWKADTYLSTAARSRTGTRTSDNAALLFLFWEADTCSSNWRLCQSTVATTRYWGGCDKAIRWDRGDGMLHQYASAGRAAIQGQDAWGRTGVLVSLMSRTPVTLYTGQPFDMNAGIVFPNGDEDTASLYAFLASDEFRRTLKVIDRQLKLTTATLLKVPFDSKKWNSRANEQYPHGLPEPYSDDPTQWLFHGHPCGSVIWDSEARRIADGPIRTDTTVLQVAVARLLGYRWPAERNPEMHLADPQRAWVNRCADLAQFAKEDGIVCLPAVRGEEPAASRLRSLLVAAYGSQWSPATEQDLLRAVCSDGQPAASLDDWLRKRFFEEHCRLFRRRPFVWHIHDGHPDGFHALVNYHRLAGSDGEGRRTLGALTFTYLGAWIKHQQDQQRDEIPGADGRLVAALELRRQLEGILEGEPPLDLFIRWKPLYHQPLGWEPDVNDGVRMNIRPFVLARLGNGGRKNAGILFSAPKIDWEKDQGEEPLDLQRRGRRKRGEDRRQEIRPKTGFPWFWSCPGTGKEDERTDFMGGPAFDGNRWNDLHYTLTVKRAARERHEREAQAEAADDLTGPRNTSDTGENE